MKKLITSDSSAQMLLLAVSVEAPAVNIVDANRGSMMLTTMIIMIKGLKQDRPRVEVEEEEARWRSVYVNQRENDHHAAARCITTPITTPSLGSRQLLTPLPRLFLLLCLLLFLLLFLRPLRLLRCAPMPAI